MFGILIALAAASEPSAADKSRYAKNQSRCLIERASDYTSGDDLIANAQRLASECISYGPPPPSCPTVEEGAAPSFVKLCKDTEPGFFQELRRAAENGAVEAIILAKRVKAGEFND